MTELTDIQRAVLTAAAERPGLQILPLPEHIKGGAAKKVTTGLLARGLVRADGDGATLIATDAGLRAIGIEPVQTAPHVDASSTTEPPTATTPKTRPGTKQATLIAMLEAPAGATIPEIAEATGWQHHTEG